MPSLKRIRAFEWLDKGMGSRDGGKMHAHHVGKYWSLGRGRLPLFCCILLSIDVGWTEE